MSLPFCKDFGNKNAYLIFFNISKCIIDRAEVNFAINVYDVVFKNKFINIIESRRKFLTLTK